MGSATLIAIASGFGNPLPLAIAMVFFIPKNVKHQTLVSQAPLKVLDLQDMAFTAPVAWTGNLGSYEPPPLACFGL